MTIGVGVRIMLARTKPNLKIISGSVQFGLTCATRTDSNYQPVWVKIQFGFKFSPKQVEFFFKFWLLKIKKNICMKQKKYLISHCLTLSLPSCSHFSHYQSRYLAASLESKSLNSEDKATTGSPLPVVGQLQQTPYCSCSPQPTCHQPARLQ